MGPNEFYTIFKLDGRDAAAGCTLRPEQLAQDVPPHWMLYITVDNADAAAAKVTAARRQGDGPAFRRHGRRPHGGDPGSDRSILLPVAAKQEHRTSAFAHVHGTLCWADLSTPDPKRAAEFYSGLFGWQFTRGSERSFRLPAHQERRALHRRHSARQAYRQPGVPPHWLAYFLVDDVDAHREQGESRWAPSSSAAHDHGRRRTIMCGDRRPAGRGVLRSSSRRGSGDLAQIETATTLMLSS